MCWRSTIGTVAVAAIITGVAASTAVALSASDFVQPLTPDKIEAYVRCEPMMSAAYAKLERRFPGTTKRAAMRRQKLFHPHIDGILKTCGHPGIDFDGIGMSISVACSHEAWATRNESAEPAFGKEAEDIRSANEKLVARYRSRLPKKKFAECATGA
jgi:hypothetical protein